MNNYSNACFQIESVVTLKKIEDTHLGEEASRHWREIDEQTYLFDRRHKEVGIHVFMCCFIF